MVVGAVRIELTASSASRKRSPTELRTQISAVIVSHTVGFVKNGRAPAGLPGEKTEKREHPTNQIPQNTNLEISRITGKPNYNSFKISNMQKPNTVFLSYIDILFWQIVF